MTQNATSRRGRREAIIAAAQRLSINCGYSGFTVEDLAEAVGVSRRTLFNHVSSKEEAVLGLLPVLTEEQAEVLRSGGPTGDLLEDVLVTVLTAIRADESDLDNLQQMHQIIERNPELIVRLKAHMEELVQQVVDELTTREGVDGARAHLALVLVGGLVQRSVEECLTDPTLGPLELRVRTNLDLARELLSARG